MFGYFSATLMRRLVALFLVVALVPLAVVSILAYVQSSDALMEESLHHLTSVREIKKNQIMDYLNARFSDLTVLTRSSDLKRAFDRLQDYHDSGGGDPNGEYHVNTDEYEDIYGTIDSYFRNYLDAYGYHDMFFICMKHGHVMYSVARKDELGTNLKSGKYKETGLARLWQDVVRKGAPTLVDFSNYSVSGEPDCFIGAPVFDETGEMSSIVVLEISITEIDRIMQERSGMGETGETYLVGDDMLMRSNSRFSSETTILKKKVETLAVREAMESRSGTQIIEDYRGEKVLSSYTHLGLDEEFGVDFEWMLISEMDVAEAFAAEKALAIEMLCITLLMTAVAGVVGMYCARSIAQPLKKLSEKVEHMAKGDLTVSIDPGDRTDEVGDLMRSFNDMMNNLRRQTQDMKEGASTLASAISQISATVAELASSAAETSTSISEITTTVEEVKQTSHLSNDKAKEVADGAREATRISHSGSKATEETVVGMHRIKEEMEYVAESILKLSDQTQSVGEIIGAVNDLADQSNLLSVNAAIEASKAGEYGKGFTVVAQEVKSLADQSKEATNQVKGILSDIQKATGTAVMATERGSKAVESGVSLSSEAGEAIGTLASNVEDSARVAMQIAVSNQEQLVGIDQLATAMQSIKDASEQNVDAAHQMEKAATDLNELATTLKELADQYQV